MGFRASEDEVGDDAALAVLVREGLGIEGPASLPVADESDVAEKGIATACVARDHWPPSGRGTGHSQAVS